MQSQNIKPTIVVLMAGEGSRFAIKGYKEPKPLIPFLGKTMIEHVLDSVNIDANWVFVVQDKHIRDWNIIPFLHSIKPQCNIVSVGNEVSNGAACSALKAMDYLDHNAPLYILNSDNILDWDAQKTSDDFLASNMDGHILVFPATDPKWSFVRMKGKYVSEVAEKKVIGTLATAGLYCWKTARLFQLSAQFMIGKQIRVNGEFYLCPVYNETILLGGLITVSQVTMHGVGTPEDLQLYIENNK